MIPLNVREAPRRALGMPASAGRLRQSATDFRVDEQLGFEASGSGNHQLLQVEKTGLNTADVAAMLASHAGTAARDTGYSGRKDRHAVCTQWFTVPFSPTVDWAQFHRDGIRILHHDRHNRKLKRGVHRANRFRIRVALHRADIGDLEARLKAVDSGGVPNYFGEQRFGRRFEEDAARLVDGARLPRTQRGMTLSGIRAALFNRVLDARVRDGTWNTALPGEYVNLDGTRSGFAASADDPGLAGRLASLDLHPTGPLYGRGANPALGEAAVLEDELMAGLGEWRAVLERAGMKFERRPTRCRVRELCWRVERADAVLELGFVLQRGQFATSVLREIVDYTDVTRPPREPGRG